jgi:hypothetical protein
MAAHPPWGCQSGSLQLRWSGEDSRLQRHTTREPWSLCRWSTWLDLDLGGRHGQETQQEAQESKETAQAGWRAARWPGTRRRCVSRGGCNVCPRAIPTVLQRSAMRSDRRERYRRDVLLRARGNIVHQRRILLLRHLRLPRPGWHMLALPGTILQCHTALLRRPVLHQRTLWWLPGPCGLL